MTKKETNTNLDKLLIELKKTPFGTVKHEKIRKKISEFVKKKYPDQFILCTHNKFSGIDTTKFPEGLNLFHDINRFNSRSSFYEDKSFYFMPREEAEYNLEHKQINVSAFITDGKGIILLRKKENKTTTLIGGHVDYSIDVYTSSQQDFLRLNMQKEIDEEIKHDKKIIVPQTSIGLINTYEKFNDLFHMSILYMIKVDNAKELFDSITTGEPDKHEVVFYEDKSHLLDGKIHHWVRYVYQIMNNHFVD